MKEYAQKIEPKFTYTILHIHYLQFPDKLEIFRQKAVMAIFVLYHRKMCEVMDRMVKKFIYIDFTMGVRSKLKMGTLWR